jgi:hypothetical protein
LTHAVDCGIGFRQPGTGGVSLLRDHQNPQPCALDELAGAVALLEGGNQLPRLPLSRSTPRRGMLPAAAQFFGFTFH